jgi:hypothetical protein
MNLSRFSPIPRIALGAFVLACGLAVQPAAAVSNCSSGALDGLSLADMTFNGAVATDCYGAVIGNDKLEAINSLAWGNDWTFLDKGESPLPASFMGVEFALDASGHTAGNWSLAGTDLNGSALLNVPMELDVVAVLKASNRYAAYYFDDVVLDGTDGGTWSIAFANHGGQIPGLSHLSFYVRVDGDGGVPSPIPEARTYAMMLVGLALVGLMARRARKTV